MSSAQGLRRRLEHAARHSPLERVTRRGLLLGAGAAGGLIVAWQLWPRHYAHNLVAAEGESIFNAYVKIAADGTVRVVVPQCEMGQGITTLLAQVVADELGADWRTMGVDIAPINPVYANRLALAEDAAMVTPRHLLPDAFGEAVQWVHVERAVRDGAMLTMGSSGVRMFEVPVREAAALARIQLQMAAGRRWGGDWHETDVAAGFVTMGKRRLRFGTLAAEAARLTPPADIEFRATSDEGLYGRSLPRLDTPAKLDGSFTFAGDVRLPDLVYAAIRQGPVGDSRLLSTARGGPAVPGLLRVVKTKRFVAAVATNWWAANQALDRLAPRFETTGGTADSRRIAARLKQAIAGGDGSGIARRGDVAAAMTGQKIVQADYLVAPALHAAIETRTATARIGNGRAEIWVASQAPAQCRAAVAAAIGLPEQSVTLYPMHAGGAFDVALEHEAACQAAIIAKAIERPVQLIWSRAEEIIRDVPRAPARARMQAVLDGAGRIFALTTRIAAPPGRHESNARLFDGASPAAAMALAAGRSDAAMVDGALPPYAIPNVAIDHVPAQIDLPVGRWRGNADSYTAFFTEAFVDEMATRANMDPFSYRMLMLSGNAALARCLTMATSMGGWQGGVAGSGQGIACHSMRGSHIAILLEAAQSERGLRVLRIAAVADIGRIINPDVARQQIEGGLIFGLAAAVGASTHYKAGVAQARRIGQLNLPLLRHSPSIQVDFVDSDRDPGGMGELGVPVVAPALANALFTLTGRRIRRLPLAARALD